MSATKFHTHTLYTSLYYTKCKQLHVLAVSGSHHQAVYLRNEKKKNYAAVAVNLEVKKSATDISPLHDVTFINISYKGEISAFRFLGAFAKLRKATISFVVFVCPPGRMEQLGFQWTVFRHM